MVRYSVKQVAKLAGISIRTLHHYDKIGLLKPSHRSEKGYRFYERKELFILQQILIYKELNFSLEEIQSIIYDAEFDLITALQSQRAKIKGQLWELTELLNTIDKTILELKDKNMKMTDEEIYRGLKPAEIQSIKDEVTNRWGKESLEEVEKKIQSVGKKGWDDLQRKGTEINQLLVSLMDLPVESPQVQKAIALHFKHLNFYYEISKERYIALGKMYTEDERFRSHYEEQKEGMAQFVRQAIEFFVHENGQI